jgi:uncharacterized protein
VNKKWLGLTGLVAIMVPVFVLAGCSPLTARGPMLGGSPQGITIGNQQEGIWVNGEGKLMVAPDIATVSLGVQAQAATVGQAQSDAASAMDRVMKALTANGIADKDIQTQNFSVSQVTRWDDPTQQQITIGYSVSNTVVAKVRELDKTGAIIDAVVAAGGDFTRVNDISFGIDDPTIYQRDARDKAMADAKNKGEQLAGLAGVRLGLPTYITESSYVPVPIYKGGAMMEGAASGSVPTTPITPGELEVTVNVQVVYSILR